MSTGVQVFILIDLLIRVLKARSKKKGLIPRLFFVPYLRKLDTEIRTVVTRQTVGV